MTDPGSGASWFHVALFWIAAVLSGLIGFASFISLVPTGWWVIRLWEFPRIQLLSLLIFPVILLGVFFWKERTLTVSSSLVIAVIAITAIWQIAHILPYTPIFPRELADTNGGTNKRLMVANVEYTNGNYNEVLSVIESQDADLLLIVEMNDAWKSNLEPLESRYPYRVEEVRDEGLGLALWSKIELTDTRVEYLVSERRPSIFASLKDAHSVPVHFVGIHPTPPGLDDSTKGGRRNSRVRDAELVLVAEEIRESNDSLWIVAGDFNDVAWSSTTLLFKKLTGMKDPRVGRMLLSTFHSEYPLLRYPIDLVFLPNQSTIGKLDRVKLPGSDHFALVLDFQLPPDASPIKTDDNETIEKANKLVDEGEEDAEERDIESDKPKKTVKKMPDDNE